jgi:hypothetical protein
MNEDMFTQYPKDHLLEGKQFFACVNNLPKKPITRGKTKPLGFQKVGHESENPKAIWFGHLVMSSRTRKC